MEPQSPLPDSPEIQSQVQALLRQFLIELGSRRSLSNLKPEASLERDLGLGSLERLEILSRLEKRFEIRFPDDILAQAETVDDLASAVANTRHEYGQTQIPFGPVEFAARHSGIESAIQPVVPPQFGFFCGESAPATLIDALQVHARQEPQRIHVNLQKGEWEHQKVRYGNLYEGGLAIAGGLLDRGLNRGDKVALMLPTGEEFLHTFLGVWLAGCVPVPIYPPFRADRIEEYAVRQTSILNNAGVRLLITFREVERLARLLRPRVSSLSDVLTKEALCSSQPSLTAQAAAPEDIALIQYTSGSTGNPKGVVLTHANLVSNIRSIAEVICLTPSDAGVSWLPLYHDMGLIGSWLFCLYFGTPLTLLSPLEFLSRPERWLWAIHYTRATLSAAPNFAYDLCTNKIAPESVEGLDLSCWRAALNGAEPVSPMTLMRFANRFLPYGFRQECFLPVYGMAECAVALTFPPLGRSPRVDSVNRGALASAGRALPSEDRDANALQFVSVGVPIPGHQIRIVEESGREVGERRQGHIHFRGPSMMQGYYGNPETTLLAFCDGWIDSGDLGYQAEGELFVTGRSKDIIIKGGRNLYPQEIEEVAASIPGIRRGCVAAFGIADSKSGTERLVIVAETRETDRETRDRLASEISTFVDINLGLPPDIVELVAPHTVPKTSSGKIQRDTCRKLYLQGSLKRPRRPLWIQILRITTASVSGRARWLTRAIGQFVYGCIAWCVLVLVWIPYGGLLQVSRRAPNPSKNRRRFRRACRMALRLAGLLPRVEGLNHFFQAGNQSQVPQPLLLVSNHSSYADPLVLGAAIPFDFLFTVKSEAARWPLVGIFIRACDYLLIHRASPMHVTSDFQQIVEALRRGSRVHLFPEATFTRARGLRPFQMGAFRLAAETGCPILPVTLRVVREVLRDGFWLPKKRPLSVVLGPLLWPQGNSVEEQVRLREAVRAEFIKHCGEGSLDLIQAGPPNPKG